MIHSASKRHTVVVEGQSDLRFFGQWIDRTKAYIKSVGGKKTVKLVWYEARAQKFESLVCVADLDFDLLLNEVPIHDDRFLYISLERGEIQTASECNDLEAAMIRSLALTKFLMQRLPFPFVDNATKLSLTVERIRERLRVSSSQLGACRAADLEFSRQRGFSALGRVDSLDCFFDAARLEVDFGVLEAFLERTSVTATSNVHDVLKSAKSLLANHKDGWGLCRGHDLCAMLAAHLDTILRRRVTADEVECGLREAFEGRMMTETQFGVRLMSLQDKIGQQLFKI